jgi:hypothetical protein
VEDLVPAAVESFQTTAEPEPEPEPELYDVEAVAALVPRTGGGLQHQQQQQQQQQHRAQTAPAASVPDLQRQSYERTTQVGFPCSVVAARVAEHVDVLRSDFAALKMGQLRKQAVAEGIEESVADSILDGTDPLADLAEALAVHVAYRPQHKAGKLSKEGSGCVRCSCNHATPRSDGVAHVRCGLLLCHILPCASLLVVRKSILRSARKMQRRYFELDDEFLCYYQNTKSAK